MSEEEKEYQTIKVPKRSSEYYSRISKMRKVKSGGKTFLDKEKAREAQRLGVEAKLRKTTKRAKGKEK
jgi:hypothetical protein